MLVRELMTTDVVTVEAAASVRTAVRTMLEADVGCVLVMEESVPVGIFTKTDALVVGYECDCPFSTIDVTEGMSDDLVTGDPEMTVREAATRMTRETIKKLPIVEDFEVVGIITVTDIVSEHSALLEEALGLNVRRREWSFEEPEE